MLSWFWHCSIRDNFGQLLVWLQIHLERSPCCTSYPILLPEGPGFIPIELKTTELLKNNRATVEFDSPECAV